MISLLLICYTFGASGQEFSVPKGYKFVKAEDYVKYELDFIKCFDWLMKVPAGEQTAKREKANKFVTEWLMGTKSVQIDVNMNIVTFMEPNPDLLMVFMAGWAKHAIETSKDKIGCNVKGLEAVIAYYQKNLASLEKDKNVEKYIKMHEKGKLKAFVTKTI